MASLNTNELQRQIQKKNILITLNQYNQSSLNPSIIVYYLVNDFMLNNNI